MSFTPLPESIVFFHTAWYYNIESTIYKILFLSGEIMMAVGERCFFPHLGANSISLKELCSCPLVVYRRWEGVPNRLFAPDSPDYLYVSDDARTSRLTVSPKRQKQPAPYPRDRHAPVTPRFPRETVPSRNN